MSSKEILTTHEDPSGQYLDTEHETWSMVDHGNYISVKSPIHGEYSFGEDGDVHPVIRDLLRTPLARRGIGVSQLSKTREYATIPNTSDFRRLGHVVDQIYAVDKIARDMGYSDDDRIAFVLYMMRDLAHGPLSHGHDIMMKDDGNEDLHEDRAVEAYRHGGIFESLKQHTTQSGEQRFPEDKIELLLDMPMPPWVEAGKPHTCGDRHQYGPEEARLWYPGKTEDPNVRTVHDLIVEAGAIDAVEVTPEGFMAFKDEELALISSKAYLLLATEHWNDPINRVQLHLLIETMRHAIVNRKYGFMRETDMGETRNPASYSYAIDQDVDEVLMSADTTERDDFVYATRALLRPISAQERERFVRYKQPQYARFLADERAQDYPSEILNGGLVDFGPPSAHVRIRAIRGDGQEPTASRDNAASASMRRGDSTIFTLDPLKNRYIDPLVRVGNGYKKLSEINSHYKEILRQQQIVQATALEVQFFVNDDFHHALVRGREQNQAKFRGLMELDEHLSRDQIRRQIEGASERALDTASKLGLLVVRAA